MAVVFLCGGTGNQMFQFTRSCPEDRFSKLFLGGFLPRILGWTEHESLLDFEGASRIEEALAMALLLIDVFLARSLGISFFTNFDLKRVKASPIIRRFVQFGYFQSHPPMRDVDAVGEHFIARRSQSEKLEIAIHIRGGDVLKLQDEGRNPYGVLTASYYIEALQSVGPDKSITVFTDDRAYAESIVGQIIARGPVSINDGGLREMMVGCMNAKHFVACNSTLSYWIVELRGRGRSSIAPHPFTKSMDLDAPTCASWISVSY